MKKIKEIINIEKIKKVINIKKIKEVFTIANIKNFIQTHPLVVKIVAVSAAAILILVLALAFDNALFPEREWEGLNPGKAEETTTQEETTTEEVSTPDPSLGEWVPIN